MIEALATEGGPLISVDTYHAETARLAVAAGAHIVNDVHGLQREPDIARVAAETGAGLVIMHTGRDREKRPDVIADQFVFLERSLEIARQAGVAEGQIVLDPGFGFAKDSEDNLQLMARFGELRALGFPLLVGTSRKRLLSDVPGGDRKARDIGTAATSVILRLKGAAIFRVHIQSHRIAIRGAVGSPPRRRKHLLAGGKTAGARSLRRRARRRAGGRADRHHARSPQRAHPGA